MVAASHSQRVMFLGTCRVHDPVQQWEHKPRPSITPHRLHSLRQIEQFIEHMTTGRVYSPMNLHLVSDYAASAIFEPGGIGRNAVWNELEDLRSKWPTFDLLFLEISTLKEQVLQLGSSGLKVGNYFTPRDIEKYRAQIEADFAAGKSYPPSRYEQTKLSTREAIQVMSNIRLRLGRRIIWLGHVIPPDPASSELPLIATRRQLASVLKAGADRLGEAYFDPSGVATEMGRAHFFRTTGDLDHFSVAASKQLAAIYHGLSLRNLNE